MHKGGEDRGKRWKEARMPVTQMKTLDIFASSHLHICFGILSFILRWDYRSLPYSTPISLNLDIALCSAKSILAW